MNHGKLDQQVFLPSSVATRHLPGTHIKMLAFFSMGTRSPAGGRWDFSLLITGLYVYQKVRTHLI